MLNFTITIFVIIFIIIAALRIKTKKWTANIIVTGAMLLLFGLVLAISPSNTLIPNATTTVEIKKIITDDNFIIDSFDDHKIYVYPEHIESKKLQIFTDCIHRSYDDKRHYVEYTVTYRNKLFHKTLKIKDLYVPETSDLPVHDYMSQSIQDAVYDAIKNNIA